MIKSDFHVYIEYMHFHHFLENNDYDFELLNKNNFENDNNFEDGKFNKFSDLLDLEKKLEYEILEEKKKNFEKQKNEIAKPNGFISFLFFFREKNFVITDLKKKYELENNEGFFEIDTNWVEDKCILKR